MYDFQHSVVAEDRRMNTRPLSSFSRILLAGCAVALGASTLYAQSSNTLPSAPREHISRTDVFLGYSYVAPHATVNTTLTDGSTFSDNLSSIDEGAIGSVAYYFNRYIGGQIEYENSPSGRNDGLQTAQAGLIARYPMQGMVPFVHALAGAVRIGGPNDEPYTYHPYTWGPALTVGGGLDYPLPWFHHHLSLRLFQADYEYLHADYGPAPVVGGRVNSNTARLSTGLVFHFGNIVPPPPVTYSCSVSPDSVYPGSSVTVTGTATNLNPKKNATYSWSGNGFTVAGDSSTGTIDTTNLQPGAYTVQGHVTQGNKVGQSADCTAHFTVKQFEPPTVSCTADPTTVKPGDSSTITATGVSPQNRPLTYSYSASEGTISGTGNTATLSTTGAPSGEVTVTCNVQDDKGQTASATTTVDVQAPPPPPPPSVQKLCTLSFDRDKRRPTRVDNEAKACLDDVALNAQRQSDATLVLVGNSAPGERMADHKAAERAENAKQYLVKDKGIDASRIEVRTGNAGAKEVDDYLVPSGANFENDVPGTQPVSQTEMHPVRHHWHHHYRHHKKAAHKM